ncbi:hypothetical protein FE257_000179 [Aspergillus nanangensis]|uniref:feruloyl esterase n=1 Tax=Aspergillus nanangensis TaxID=2582783 RepID=A0AAD4CYX4_ASPNN|nr:hypothetical protein FE257_000179 [Aspergillus nanangensis]
MEGIITLYLITLFWTSVASAARSPGCGHPLPNHVQAGSKSHQVQLTTTDGLERSYRVHIPAAYDINAASPLIFSFHGRTKTAESQEELSQFSNAGWNPQAIAVYPQGVNNSWQGDPDSTVNDIAFTMEMLDHLLSEYCIDPTRVYAAGKSNGGGFSHLLACDPIASTRIAAFAMVSGAYYQQTSEADCHPTQVPIKCNPGRSPVPVIEFHGTDDHTIPYDGEFRRGECLPAVAHFVQEWAHRDGLGRRNGTTELFEGKVQEYQYGTGDGEGTVTHYRVEGLGHSWPSVKPNSDNPDGTYLDATPIIMRFFGRWALSGST